MKALVTCYVRNCFLVDLFPNFWQAFPPWPMRQIQITTILTKLKSHPRIKVMWMHIFFWMHFRSKPRTTHFQIHINNTKTGHFLWNVLFLLLSRWGLKEEKKLPSQFNICNLNRDCIFSHFWKKWRFYPNSQNNWWFFQKKKNVCILPSLFQQSNNITNL